MAGNETVDEPKFKPLHPDAARVILEMMPAAVIVTDRAGRIRGFGKAAQELFGYDEAEVLGRDVAMLAASSHRRRHAGYVDRFADSGKGRAMGGSRIENACRKDGSVFPVEISLRETRLDGEACLIGFVRSLASPAMSPRELHALLADLAHASRVASMGALATAIAHELNQPLTAVTSYAQGLRDLIARRDDFAEQGEYLRLLDACIAQAMRAGQLLHRMREFVRGGGPRPRVTSAAAVIDDAIALALINGSKRLVKVTTQIAADLPCVMVDPMLAQQVVFNLLRNAIEAIDGGDGREHRLQISAAPSLEPGFVEIAIEDNGPGIADEVAASLFESFVTTKREGMGIGLAICRQIVGSWGGGSPRAGPTSWAEPPSASPCRWLWWAKAGELGDGGGSYRRGGPAGAGLGGFPA